MSQNELAVDARPGFLYSFDVASISENGFTSESTIRHVPQRLGETGTSAERHSNYGA